MRLCRQNAVGEGGRVGAYNVLWLWDGVNESFDLDVFGRDQTKCLL